MKPIVFSIIILFVIILTSSCSTKKERERIKNYNDSIERAEFKHFMDSIIIDALDKAFDQTSKDVKDQPTKPDSFLEKKVQPKNVQPKKDQDEKNPLTKWWLNNHRYF